MKNKNLIQLKNINMQKQSHKTNKNIVWIKKNLNKVVATAVGKKIKITRKL